MMMGISGKSHHLRYKALGVSRAIWDNLGIGFRQKTHWDERLTSDSYNLTSQNSPHSEIKINNEAHRLLPSHGSGLGRTYLDDI
jgi:hypothetical protein